MRKFLVSVSLVVAAFVLTGGTVLAFECYNTERSDQGNESAAGAPALISLDEALVMFCGVDPADTGAIKSELEDEGFRTDVLINGHALMAGGLEKSEEGEEKLDDGQGIDHLTDEFFAALAEIEPSCA
jgi:hypothetical protein